MAGDWVIVDQTCDPFNRAVSKVARPVAGRNWDPRLPPGHTRPPYALSVLIGEHASESDGNGNGVIIAQGGITGGWSIYLNEGVPTYCYNFVGLDHTFVRGDEPIKPGTRQVRMEFDYDGGGVAKGGMVGLFVDGDRVGSGRVERTEPFIYSADETCDIGSDDASAVSSEYTPTASHFTGKINWVELATDEAAEDEDHYLTREERFRVAMAIQ